MEKKSYELKINEHFANVMPPLNNRELESLKSSILEYGCINPIVVWYGTIVDGHHRYAICKENGIPFGIAEVAFEDEMEAVLWICQTHFSQRSFTPFQRMEIVLQFEDEIKARSRKQSGRGNKAEKIIDEDVNDLALRLINETWSRDRWAHTQYMLNAVRIFVRTFGSEVDEKRFVKKLSCVSYQDLYREGSRYLGVSAASRYAYAITHFYNKHVSKNILPVSKLHTALRK